MALERDIEILEKAYSLIRNRKNWVAGKEFANENGDPIMEKNIDKACRYCAYGAIRKAVIDNSGAVIDNSGFNSLYLHRLEANKIVVKYFGMQPHELTYFNDSRGHLAIKTFFRHIVNKAKGMA